MALLNFSDSAFVELREHPKYFSVIYRKDGRKWALLDEEDEVKIVFVHEGVEIKSSARDVLEITRMVHGDRSDIGRLLRWLESCHL
jgi:hypothetical protein